MRARTVSLDDFTYNTLKLLGNGNVSAGIRAAAQSTTGRVTRNWEAEIAAASAHYAQTITRCQAEIAEAKRSLEEIQEQQQLAQQVDKEASRRSPDTSRMTEKELAKAIAGYKAEQHRLGYPDVKKGIHPYGDKIWR